MAFRGLKTTGTTGGSNTGVEESGPRGEVREQLTRELLLRGLPVKCGERNRECGSGHIWVALECDALVRKESSVFRLG